MELTVSIDSEPEDWDSIIQSIPKQASLYQSAIWAKINQELDQATPIFLYVEEGQEIVASLLCFHSLPWDRYRNKRKRSFLNYMLGRNRGSILWRRGPTITRDREKNIEALSLILEWLEKYAETHSLFEIRGMAAPHNALSNSNVLAEVFNSSGFQSREMATFLMDLTVGEEDLWRNLKRSARKSVKKAKRLGVSVEQIRSKADFENHFVTNYRNFEEAAGRKVYSISRFVTMWDKDDARSHKYFFAKADDGQVLAVLGMNIFNQIAIEVFSAMSQRTFAEKIPAQDLLHWEIMLDAKLQGCHIFDLAGVNPDPIDDKGKGIRRFKEKWGGEYVTYPRYWKVIHQNYLQRMFKS